jgi:hypothetical protein
VKSNHKIQQVKLHFYSCTVTKSEPRRIWPNKIIPCDESDIKPLRAEHEETDVILSSLIEQKMKINQEIQLVKDELNKYQTEEMLKKKLKPKKTSPEEEVSKPIVKKRYIYQNTFFIPNEVSEITCYLYIFTN